jgi:poly(3-hydroxybutyrate) depolymerase
MTRIGRRTHLALRTAGLMLTAVNASFGQPVITAQPLDQTNVLGTIASFTVGAIGTPEPAYQWQKLEGNWTNLADRTNATLVLTDVQTSDEADYRAVVTNPAGTTNSVVAHLYVVEPPDSVLVSNDQFVVAGADPRVAVYATGTSLAYQWWKDGVALPGATNSTLAFSNVQPTNAGAYTVRLTNLAGAVTSRVAQLSVATGWVFTNAQGTQLPYRLFLPPKYNPATNYPLVLFWHGAGEVGTDNVGQMKDNGQFAFLSASNMAKYPCFYLAPQIPYSLSYCGQYDTFLKCATNLLSDLEGQFAIDPDRVYVTGLSMGGFLSWIMVARHPELLAAAVPMSAGWACSSVQDAPPLSLRVPIWNFHATNDGTIAVSWSDNGVAGLRSAGANILYTRYQSGGHGIWPTAYRTPVLVDWLMAQRRGATPTNQPLLSITHPTGEPGYRTDATNLDLSGSAGALGQAVTLVSWTNLANYAKATALGSNAWTATSIPIVADQTNLIIATATTTSWSPSYRGNTTFNDTLAVMPSPIRLTVAWQGTEALLNWMGGGPPYRIQRATDLVVGDWTDFLINVTPPASVTMTGQVGFYRIVGQ